MGTNSRLDEIQAGLLRVKLQHLPELTTERAKICESYLLNIRNPRIKLPEVRKNATAIWHQFVIRCEERDRLQEFLKKQGIDCIIHYPIPPHLSEAYRYLGMKEGSLPITEKYAREVLSLPLYNGMTEDEYLYVADCINHFV